MNKYLLLFIAAFSVSVNAFSQGITIGEADMPDAPLLGQGDTIRYSTAAATTAGIDVSQTGANHNWNFSFLQASGQSVNEYKNSATTLYSLLGAGFNAIGLKQADVNLQVVQLTDSYEFYNKSTAVFEAKATGYSISGVPLGSTYSNTDKIYQFPLNYNDVDSDNFHYTLSISNVPGISISVTYIRAGKRINEVDGYGSITTPFGTYNCIRVKSTITETDSIDFGFFPLAVPNNRVEYKWLANGIKIPVLEIDGTDVFGTFTINTIKYRDNYINLLPNAEFVASNTSPLRWQPVNFTNQTTTASTATPNYKWTITPASMFSFQAGSTQFSANPVVIFNVDTNFTVMLKATNSAGADSITKIEYIKVGHEIAGLKTENAKADISIFPNPSTGIFTIKSTNVSQNTSICILSILGEEIYSKKITAPSTIIDLSEVSKGVYFVKTIGEKNKMEIKKLILE